MKQKIILTIGLFQLCFHGWGQQNPTPYATPLAGTPAQAVTTANAAWYRGGNSPGGTAGNANIFGTNAGFNSPIYTVTNGVNRTTLMGFQPIGSITGGFGLGTNLLLPQAKLHIQDFGTDPTYDAQGRMFRTDGIGNRDNRWNMFTTNNGGIPVERLRIQTTANSSNIAIQVVQQDGVLSLQTGTGITRNRLMVQRDNIGPLNGVNTAGFVAIYSHTPLIQRMAPRAPLHVFGVEQANAQGWTRGILLSNSAILQWDGGNTSNNPRGFFIGHPSDLPNGNLFGGIVGNGTASNLNANAPVDYSYTISVNSPIPVTSPTNTINPLGTWNFYKNVLISQVNANQVTVNNERRLGINTLLPQNVVEINTAETSAIPGRSGLRLTDLTASSNVLSNPGNGVLAVDSNGNVIYVEQTIDSLGFGYTCDADSSTYFTEHRKVNFNNNNFYFEGDADTAYLNRVGIGWPCGTTLKAKLDVFTENRASTAGSFMTLHNWTEPYGTNFTGALGMTLGDGGGTAAFYGLRGHVFAGNFTSAAGVYGWAPVTANSYAGYFDGDVFSATYVYTGSDSTLKKDINKLSGGLKIITQLSPKTFYWDAQDNPQFNFSNQLQYGFIAQEVQNVLPSLVKQSRSEGEYDANGNFISNPKDFLALNYNAIIPINTQAIIELNQKVERATLSDETIKTNVQDLTGSLDKVLNMRGVSYDWNHTVHPELNLDSANHVGFIAQEMQQVDTRLTYLADDSLLHVEYDKVVPILAEAIQELNDSIIIRDSIIAAQGNQIEDLNNRLTQLENCLSGILPYLCQMSQSAVQANTPQSQEAIRAQLQVKLSNREAIILDQNVPNPFAEQTVINFSIPETVKKAQIHFYNGTGQLMQSVDVTERGLGSLTVFGSDLSSGTYTYTLVADGVVVATKKMVKQ